MFSFFDGLCGGGARCFVFFSFMLCTFGIGCGKSESECKHSRGVINPCYRRELRDIRTFGFGWCDLRYK